MSSIVVMESAFAPLAFQASGPMTTGLHTPQVGAISPLFKAVLIGALIAVAIALLIWMFHEQTEGNTSRHT